MQEESKKGNQLKCRCKCYENKNFKNVVQEQEEVQKCEIECICDQDHYEKQFLKNLHQMQENTKKDKTDCLCDDYKNKNFKSVVQMQDEIKKCKESLEFKKRGLIEWIKQRTFELVPKKSACVNCELYKLNICDQNTDGCAPKVFYYANFIFYSNL